jgi:hypothetical protein
MAEQSCCFLTLAWFRPLGDERRVQYDRPSLIRAPANPPQGGDCGGGCRGAGKSLEGESFAAPRKLAGMILLTNDR